MGPNISDLKTPSSGVPFLRSASSAQRHKKAEAVDCMPEVSIIFLRSGRWKPPRVWCSNSSVPLPAAKF